MIKHFVDGLKKYAVFTGRASRANYWYFVLAYILIGWLIGYIGGAFNLPSKAVSYAAWIVQIGLFVPSFAISIRRMHDTNKSGWFILVPLYNFILLLTKGTAGPNKYGPDPLQSTASKSEAAQQ